MDLWMACLERRRSALSATTRLLAHVEDEKVAARAVELVQGLESLGACADAEALSAAFPPPQDAHVRQQVEAVRARADEAQALLLAGRYKEALAGAGEVLSRARPLAYPPLTAEALVLAGRVQALTNELADAEGSLVAGAQEAAHARADLLVASAWTELVHVHHHEAQHAEALAMGRAAEAAIRRAGDPVLVRARLWNHLGNVAFKQARFEEAASRFRDVVALLQAERGSAETIGMQLAVAHSNLGGTLKELGRYEESREEHLRALALLERVAGPNDPRMAQARGNLAILAMEQERFGEALTQVEAGLRIKERTLKPDDISLATTLLNAAIPYLALGRFADARRSLERAYAILEKRHGPEHPDVATAVNNLGDLGRAEGRPAEALRLHEQARGVWERALGAEHPDVALALEGVGADLAALGENARVRRAYEQSVRLWAKAESPDTPDAARSRLGLGEVLLALGHTAQARAQLERAVKVLAAEREGPTVRGRARAALARAPWSEPAQRPRALQLASAAKEDFLHSESVEARQRLSALEGWLAQR